MSLEIRPEHAGDEHAIGAVIAAAFAGSLHSDGTEAQIVERLRERGALTLSLVAQANSELVGHAAFSPVTVDGEKIGWFGLGPVSVIPERQGEGIGSRLIMTGMAELGASGAAGCVVLGDPEFYGRFGFRVTEGLTYPDAPARYFQALCLCDEPAPAGLVDYHSSFVG